MPLPQPGDHLVSPRAGYQHHGLYLGDHQVIHYQCVFRRS
ncbi:lecithin retinol acyltransferase family protein [Aeromonas caviae]